MKFLSIIAPAISLQDNQLLMLAFISSLSFIATIHISHSILTPQLDRDQQHRLHPPLFNREFLNSGAWPCHRVTSFYISMDHLAGGMIYPGKHQPE